MSFPEREIKERTVQTKSKPQWFCEHLSKMKGTLDALEVIARVTGSDETKAAYKIYKKSYRAKTSEARREEVERRIDSSANKPRAIWAAINEDLKKPNTRITPEVEADVFNQHFCTVAERVSLAIPGPRQLSSAHMRTISTTGSFYLVPVTPSEVLRIGKELKDKKTADAYGMSAAILKKVIDLVAQPLSDLVNVAFMTGDYPAELKLARVLPIYKKGDRKNPDNYIPISILPAISKIFETALKNRLIVYLEKSGLLSDDQFAYRTGRSTTSAVIRTVNLISDALDSKSEACLTLCDLSKAFDCVDHSILLEKMATYGIRGVPLRLFGSYLENRRQLVDVGGKMSSIAPIRMGVAQGSVMAAFLFVLFINDLPDKITTAKVTLFADDASALSVSERSERLVDESDRALAAATEWFCDNGLKINEDKTQRLVISTRGGENHDPVKFLGVVINQDLRWDDHVEQLARKLCPVIFAIRRMRRISNMQAALTVYHSYFMSRATYAILVWGASTAAHKIFVQQKEAVRALLGVEYGASCRRSFRDMGILTLSSFYILAALIYIYTKTRKTSLGSEV